MTLSVEEIQELLSKDMSKEDFKSLISHFKKLVEELGNGTLTKLKENKEKCNYMCQKAGELNDIILGE